jgi:type IV secretion system protein VirB6
MIAACPPVAPDSGFARSMLGFIDCQAQSIGAGGYQALAAPGSTLSLVLTGFLTLFIATFGYRLLFGHSPDVRSGVLGLAKIGFVLALATSWPAYRTLAYDVFTSGPSQMSGEIGAPAGLPGADGGLVDRLDLVDQGLATLAVLGAGEPPVLPYPNPSLQIAPEVARTPQPFPGFNTFAIGGARMIFLIGAIGALAAVRIIVGLMLAIGPFFIAFLLFENTRSLFEGWLRVIAGTALAALATMIALGVELALLEPWLADILARRTADEALPAVPTELLVVTCIFTLVLLAMFVAAARVAFAFRLAPMLRAVPPLIDRIRSGREREVLTREGASAPYEVRSRAAAVVDAVAATQRREAVQGAGYSMFVTQAGVARSDRRGAEPQGAARERDAPASRAPVPLGQSFNRRTRGRTSASANRRNRAS